MSLHKSMRATIVGSKLVKGGLFSSNYMTYTIQTKPIEYLVERKLADFFWLRNILCREYPGVYVGISLRGPSHC